MLVIEGTADARSGAANAYDGSVRHFRADRVFLDQVRVLVVLIGRAWLAGPAPAPVWSTARTTG